MILLIAQLENSLDSDLTLIFPGKKCKKSQIAAEVTSNHYTA